MNNNTSPILEVSDLRTYFHTEDGVVKAVDGVDFAVNKGEILGLVGESGCGKSVTALSMLRLIAAPGQIESGQVYFEGENLFDLSEDALVGIRGDRISMIFQQPQTSLNPVLTIGFQIAEVFRHHQNLEQEEAWEKAVALLTQVGISGAEEKAHAFPHEVSGGQAQRVMIAMALALNPSLLIADEPTTALDVTIQAQILELLEDLCRRLQTAVILITHDLAVVAETADHVAVMYAGQIVEKATVETFFELPLHPYSRGLINSIPVLGQLKDRLETIEGSVPNLIDLPPGCRFASRCLARIEHQIAICAETEPPLEDVQSKHRVRCWLYHDSDQHKAPLNVSDVERRTYTSYINWEEGVS